MSTDTAQITQEVFDRESIRQVIYGYARAIDRLDGKMFRSMFWDDGIYQDGPISGPAGEFAETLINEGARVRFASSMHIMWNILMRIEGDDAYCEVYGGGIHLSHPTRESQTALIGAEAAAQFAPSDEVEFRLVGRYLDHFQRRKGQWRILSRRFIPEFTDYRLYRRTNHVGMAGRFGTQSIRGPEDVSYDWFR